MNNFANDFGKPIVVLVVICLVVSLALAGTYQLTSPIITANQLAAENAAIAQVLPAADAFDEITDNLPEEVQAVYKAQNGAGIVVKVGCSGYSGPVVMMIGIDNEGLIQGINTTEHAETSGIGTKVLDESYTSKYINNPDTTSVESIVGATRTSTALKNNIAKALEVYSSMKEAQ